MKKLTLVCLLLSLCASSIVAGPPPHSNRQTSGESKCSAGFKECQESLIDFKAAEQFMQLKATVLADLNRLEKSRPTKPKIAPVRDADVNRQKTGNGAIYSATVGPNRKSSVQAMSAAQPVSLESTGRTLSYKRTAVKAARCAGLFRQDGAGRWRYGPTELQHCRGGSFHAPPRVTAAVYPAYQSQPSGPSPRPVPRLLLVLDRAEASERGDK